MDLYQALATMFTAMRLVSYLDCFGIKFQPFLLVDKKFLDVFTLVTLELNHLAHLGVVDNSAIAG